MPDLEQLVALAAALLGGWAEFKRRRAAAELKRRQELEERTERELAAISLEANRTWREASRRARAAWDAEQGR